MPHTQNSNMKVGKYMSDLCSLSLTYLLPYQEDLDYSVPILHT